MKNDFTPTGLKDLLRFSLSGLQQGRYFGLPKELFFYPAEDDPFHMFRYNRRLETPFGVAAGPHTQLTQNIVAAWLCGARFIELKTVQLLDDLRITKPCIDMGDSGYNCEWSQELSVKDSLEQYRNAWITIHLLRRLLGMKESDGPGLIFNMSVGYDLKGIQSEKVQRFLSEMKNSGEVIDRRKREVSSFFPEALEIPIGSSISDNVTLSTMHGCPPEEIEEIGAYLLDSGFHTTIKLNPLLLGLERISNILKKTGYEVDIPDDAFAKDLKYDEAVRIINNLSRRAKDKGLSFGIKLTNTLACLNRGTALPAEEPTVYMSGKAIHPVSVALACALSADFGGAINISFAGGADCFNLSDLLACGLAPVTVCSDLLRPGGYGLLSQYISNIRASCKDSGAGSLEEFILTRSGNRNASVADAALENLIRYNAGLTKDTGISTPFFIRPSIKSNRPLGAFDCIQAPCTHACPTNQDIPDYLCYTASGDFSKAFQAILKMNPFPNVTGTVCNHVCQTRCNRMNYDDPLRIRDVKRFVADRFEKKHVSLQEGVKNGISVAVIGAGPSGLACAFFLALAGFSVTIFESGEVAGGMITDVIPTFRLPETAFMNDLKRIEQTGVQIAFNTEIGKDEFRKIRKEFDFVYVAIGAGKSRSLNINGGGEAIEALDFLKRVKEGKNLVSGNNIIVIGGGNTAMDAARAAVRLGTGKAKVTLLYRRTAREMPAGEEEIIAALHEGIDLMELVAPVEIVAEGGRVISVRCIKMALSEPDGSGRPAPVPVAGSEFTLPADMVIAAVGQEAAPGFLSENANEKEGKIWFGGDAKRGPATIIEAVGDGRKAAEEIMRQAQIKHRIELPAGRISEDYKTLMVRRFRKEKSVFPVNQFEWTEDLAQREAARCLLCDELCNICVTLCPNLALFPYSINPVHYQPDKLIKSGTKWVREKDVPFIVEQKHQILHIGDWCNRCGNCTTFCPTEGSPYREKPSLFIDYKAFLETHGSYHLRINGAEHSLLYNNQGVTETLIRKDMWFFSSENMQVFFDTDTFAAEKFEISSIERELKFNRVAEMSVIIQGAYQFFNLSI